MAFITINWGLQNSVVIGMVSFEDGILKDVVYDMDIVSNVLMYLQNRPSLKDSCENFIYTIVSNVGTMTREFWDSYHRSNASGFMQYSASQVIARQIDKAELQQLFELYQR